MLRHQFLESRDVDRLVAYADAGADFLYAPGIMDLSAIRTLVSAVILERIMVFTIT
jgi:2-methylisocitrate lyase-like PEP mutase family enzyme